MNHSAVNPVQGTAAYGERLRRRRKSLGITQDQVAVVIGVNRRVIGQLERGKPTVRLEIALEAARAVGLDLDLVPRS